MRFVELVEFKIMITSMGSTHMGTVRSAQFCSLLISVFEALSSEAKAKKAPHQVSSKIRQFSLP